MAENDDKYLVFRTDGRDREDEKHANCEYFVIDLTHDPFAQDVIQFYIHLCEHEYPEAANDITERYLNE